jgi:hypothetical protein
VVIDPINATTVVAPERLIYTFLPIPDAESLPLYRCYYRMVLKQACVGVQIESVDVDVLGSGAHL